MDKPILIRSLSNESREAVKYLKENNIDFIEIFSERDEPKLESSDSIYPYNGLDEIKEYVKTRSII